MGNDQRNLAGVLEFTEAFNERNIEAALAPFAADGTVSRGDGQTLEGRDAVGELLRGLVAGYPDCRLALRGLDAFGETAVCAEWWLCGTHEGRLDLPWEGTSASASGRTVALAFAALMFFDRGGKIERMELRGNAAALLAEPATAPQANLQPGRLYEMARGYAAAWCSGDPTSVGAFYAENGWIIINGGAPHPGRAGVIAMAAGFMGAFPGMELTMDDLQISGDRVVFSWTLKGANTGPGGTGRQVSVGGFEIWRIDENYQVAESHGYFDSASYAFQLDKGPKAG